MLRRESQAGRKPDFCCFVIARPALCVAASNSIDGFRTGVQKSGQKGIRRYAAGRQRVRQKGE
jgi:hypothetical protein